MKQNESMRELMRLSYCRRVRGGLEPPKGGEPKIAVGLRYEVCQKCGLEWNVSRRRPAGKYICPNCGSK